MARSRTAPAPTDDLALNIRAFERALRSENKAEATIAAYLWAAQRLEAFLDQRGLPRTVATITREHVQEFLIDGTTKYSPASQNQTYRSLQALWKYLTSEELVPDSPLRHIAKPTIPDNPPPVVTPAQMQALLKTCEGKTFSDRRDTAILSLFYDSGIRRAEMSGIQVTDIDVDVRNIIVTGKGNRRRTVGYGFDTSRRIDRYLRVRAQHQRQGLPALWLGERGAVTSSGIEQLVRRRAREANLAHVHPHAFRHSAASELLGAGMQEADVMSHMGWRAHQMITRYGRVTAAERARRNYDQFSPMDRLRRSG